MRGNNRAKAIAPEDQGGGLYEMVVYADSEAVS